MAEKPLVFSRHARNRMRKEQVDRGSVELCVREPEATTVSYHGRVNYWSRHGSGYLRVTIAEDSVAMIIVTVTVRRRGPEA